MTKEKRPWQAHITTWEAQMVADQKTVFKKPYNGVKLMTGVKQLHDAQQDMDQ